MSSFFEVANLFASRWLPGMWPIIWQSTALAGIVYLLTLCLRRASAAVRFWLWMLVPLRLLVMPLVTISLPLLPAATMPGSVNIESLSAKPVVAGPPTISVPEAAPVAEESGQIITVAEADVAGKRVWPSAWALLMVVWLAGVTLWSIRLFLGWCRIRRVVRRAAEVNEDIVLSSGKKAAAMLGLRCLPRILVTEENISPFLFGLLRPVVVVPARLVSKVRNEELFAVFAHEFAHLRRRDPLIGWVLAVCEAVYFFHPVFHFVKWRILFERERACDDWVIAASKTRRSIYAHALINAADICRSFSAKIGPVGAVAESFGDLKKRILAIGSNLKPKARLSMRALILLVVTGAVCVPGIVVTARSASRQTPTSKTVDPMTSQPEEVSVSSSRAWYIMRQWNAGSLLLGLTQRLGKLINSAQPDDPVWTGVTNGGRLELNIAVEGDVTGEIFVGFFKDATWSAEPVQVRRFRAAGKHIVENLPLGKFQMGAMIGRLPVAAALGVQRMWPEPVEVTAGATSTADVLLSPEFEQFARGWHNPEFSRDFIGDWQDMDTDNLLQGRVTGPGGRPIAFAKIAIREYNPGARGIAAPDRGTNEQGYYKYDGMRWPYWVSATWMESLPSLFGCRYQDSSLNRVLEGPQKINFQFDSFPTGTATLTGKVTDQNGNPVREFFLNLETRSDWEDKRKNPDGKYYNVVGYRIPFISQDGVFRLGDLPSGVFLVGAIPFNSLVYEFGRRQEVKLEAGKTTNVNLEVTAKDIFYGRVLFRDGSPAVAKPASWPRADILLVMPMPGEGIARGVMSHSVADVEDDGYFAVHLSEAEIEQLKSGRGKLVINIRTAQDGPRKYMGEFPFALLAKDKSKAGVLNIAYPPGEKPSLVDKPLANDCGWVDYIHWTGLSPADRRLITED